MDALDLRILWTLGVEPFSTWPPPAKTLRVQDVARALGKSPRLVKDRIERLERDGIVTGYGVFPNLRHFGYHATTFHVPVDGSPNEERLDRLGAVDGFLNAVNYLNSGLCLTLAHATPTERARRIQVVSSLMGSRKQALPLYEHHLPHVPRRLTSLDWRIVQALAANARRPLHETAKAVNVSTKTVRTRLAQMRDEGSIQEHAWVNFQRIQGVLPFELALWHQQDAPNPEPALLHAFRDRLLTVHHPPQGGYAHLLLRVFAPSPSEVESMVRLAASVPGVARVEPLLAAGATFNTGWITELLQQQVAAPVPSTT